MLRIGFIALVVAASGFAAHAQQAPVSPSPIKRTPTGKSEVPNSNFEVITAVVEIAWLQGGAAFASGHRPGAGARG
ncbi:hypothetical protein [Pseudorhodoplanes sp.]|uniref:hypothetical protein n=1 Tax=Pseudorhodoplanes sp. TaxID=1934341 RepID=UPI002B56ACB4|nr:hypothetical protein [Pseudorhodoplanes sp.]HWV52066.1 hypothetical protein [Pseudorhodoplanes sp.]